MEPVWYLPLLTLLELSETPMDPFLDFSRNPDIETETLVGSRSRSKQSRVKVITTFISFMMNCFFPSHFLDQKEATEGEMVLSIV